MAGSFFPNYYAIITVDCKWIVVRDIVNMICGSSVLASESRAVLTNIKWAFDIGIHFIECAIKSLPLCDAFA